MMDIKTKIEGIDTYGDNSEDRKELIVKNHWHRNDIVVLELEGKEIEVFARELKRAIENATNL
ncbi:hypothetical protein AKJ59_00850 [candidate division MSBL1 archaeon SCGC-AAA385M02]|uniref:Uncharacterized protein n=1 Tax=candidate division MSBL1 archaeon SCGC-AAA385M02 TaxID=1698287 RepID=A0A133VPX3_9EURY|nr:hypothetical protein AKJ59_00850 [candidate division MSBL1 archaeon SCGC-AAA385M02]